RAGPFDLHSNRVTLGDGALYREVLLLQQLSAPLGTVERGSDVAASPVGANSIRKLLEHGLRMEKSRQLLPRGSPAYGSEVAADEFDQAFLLHGRHDAQL